MLRLRDDRKAKIALGHLLTDFSNVLVLERQSERALLTAYEASRISEAVSDDRLAAKAANALGAAFRQQGNIISAIAWLEKSFEIQSKFKQLDNFLAGDAALRLSYLYEALGEYKLALQNLQTAEKSFNRLNQPLQNLQLWRAIAGFYNNHGQPREAVRYLLQACELATKLEMTRRAVNCQTEIGLTYLWEKDFESAATAFETAEKGALQINADDLRVKILMGKAFLNGQNKQFKLSLETFETAENLTAQKGEWTDKLTINWLKSLILLKQQNLTESLATVEKAISLAEGHQDTNSLPFLLELKGKILLSQKQKKSARETLSRAISLIEQSRTQISDASSSTGFLSERSESYRNLLELELEENNSLESLIVTEKLKSRWLIDQSTNAKSVTFQSQQSWQSTNEAANLREKILAASGRYLADALDENQELFSLEKNYQQKLENFQMLSDAKLELLQGKLTNSNLSGLISDERTAIVSFGITATNRIVAFVIRQDRLKGVLLKIDYSTIAQKIREFRREISVFDPNCKQSAKRLYADLLQPIESEIASVEKLIFVPDLGLWELPFQALIGGDGKYLIEKYEVSYVPSLTALQNQMQTKNTSKQLLAFANSLTERAKPLKEAEREVVNVSQMYRRPLVYLKDEATETRFKQEIAKAGLIHLAVHGEVNHANPFESALLLTKDAREDGRLTVSEILQLPRLPNSLIVLSGCDTSNGQVLSGEGLLSLSWAFLAAGGSGVVAAQWAVEEKTTADLMINFHYDLNQARKQAAAALRTAQLTALKKSAPFNHPFYWAAFLVVGADSQRWIEG